MKTSVVIVLLLPILCAMVATAQRPSTNPHAPVIARWQALIPTIQSLFDRRGYKCPAPPEESHIGIIDAADFHGLSVALVDWCPGGAYTDWIVAMQLEGDEPVLSRFTKSNGKIENVDFLQGASVMHGADVKLAPGKNAIYGIHWDNDQEMRLSCGADAYVWNRKTRSFRLDAELTKQASQTYCQQVQQEQEQLGR